MRSDLNPIVIGVTVLIAALAQDLIRVTPWLPVKVNFLTAVALFYIVSRTFLPALAAVVWAGVLTDALGGLPLFCTTSFLLFAYLLVHFLRGFIYRADVLTGAVLCALISLFQMLWMRIWVDFSCAIDLRYGFIMLGYSIAAGAIAGASGFAVCLMVDRFSGCTKSVKDKNGLSWTEAD
jgi:hypothetical protein